MRHKIGWILLAFICLLFFFQVVFAQVSEDLKSEIYSKLKCCPCNVSFDKCVCPEASQIKAYVDALLEEGTDKSNIFYKVAKKFSLDVIFDAKIKADVEKRLITEAGAKRPQIVFEPASFNFGEVSKKQGKVNKILSYIIKVIQI